MTPVSMLLGALQAIQADEYEVAACHLVCYSHWRKAGKPQPHMAWRQDSIYTGDRVVRILRRYFVRKFFPLMPR